MTLTIEELIALIEGLWKLVQQARHPPAAVGVYVGGNLLGTITANRKAQFMATLNVGHGTEISIRFLDQHGNPMLVTPVVDAPPIWTDAPNPAGDAVLTVAPDAMTATLDAKAVGTDVVSIALKSGGKDFSASISFTITEEPQVLTSIELVSAVP